MIRKEDIRKAVAESVGIHLNQSPESQTRDGVYLFRTETETLHVTVSKGVVWRVSTGLHPRNLAVDDGEETAKASRHPYVGLGLTEAVLQHMEEHPAPTFYDQIAIEG